MQRDDPGAYLPIDRLHAIARGEGLPVLTHGAALFADVAGFTPLTEALARTLGPRLGAEELSRQLNLVYDALVAETHRYGGSVVNFSGDAITCWFDGDNGLRATACALELHGALARVGTVVLPTGGRVNLAMKVAVASGPARRLVVGDPAQRLLDVLAGATLERMAAAEHLAHRAEVVLSPECAPALGDTALILEWRVGPDGAERFPVVGGLIDPVPPAPWPALPNASLPAQLLGPWLVPALREQLLAGQGELQPELRPATALFLRFGAIDYDADPAAHAKLDAYIRWVQGVLARYEGTLLQLTLGDKGSYLYAIFGAPVAHEHDALRAAMAALELRTPPDDLAFIAEVQIGISAGVVWAGAYGGSACRTYGVLGDQVNLAARLMQHADRGEILVTEPVRRAVASAIEAQILAPIEVKGKSRPVAVARLLNAWPAPESLAARPGPLVGRAAELDWLREHVRPILGGQFAGVVAIYGEPGIGKSRLVEALREELAPSCAWLSCPADQLVRPSLHPFRRLLRRHFAQRPAASSAENAACLEAALAELLAVLDTHGAHSLGARLTEVRPTLTALVDLPTTGARQDPVPADGSGQAVAALATLICAECVRRPVVLHMEDAAWLDADSLAVLGALATAAADLPLAVLISSRYGDDGARLALPVGPATPTATLYLGGLDEAAALELATATMGAQVPAAMAASLVARANGNALFVEELALDLRERGALAAEAGEELSQPANDALQPLQTGDGRVGSPLDELPASIAAVLIARLDRLPYAVRAATQIAAVLGTEFDLPVLAQICGTNPQLAAGIRQAIARGIWVAAGEARYRFRHALLRDTAYQLQLQARQRELHGLAAEAIEQIYGESLAAQIPALAHHARLAGDARREQQYLALLGEQAFNIGAFAEALVCFERALSLIPAEAPAPRGRILARLARTHGRLGQPDTALQLYEASLALAEATGDQRLHADSSYELGILAQKRADYAVAQQLLEQALAGYTTLDDSPGQGRTLNRLGAVAIELNEADKALEYYQAALRIGRRARR